MNLYGFVGNDGLGRIDKLGLIVAFDKRPCLGSIAINYPGYDKYGGAEVYETCGGDVKKASDGDKNVNSCALRVCMGLNGSNYKIDGNGDRYIKGKDGNFHLRDAGELMDHLEKDWGKPDLKEVWWAEGASDDWTNKIKRKCAIVFYVKENWRPWHVGLHSQGQPFKDTYGGTSGKAIAWFIPCTCELGAEKVCEPCKGTHELDKAENP